jgi:predicted nucleic acid-binding protein
MIYLDTGCLVKLYYPEEDSEVIAIKTAGLPIAFTPLHNL